MSEVTVKLDHDTVDNIVVQELEWQLKYFKDEIIKHAKGGWLHPDDLEAYIEDYIAMKRVLGRYKV